MFCSDIIPSRSYLQSTWMTSVTQHGSVSLLLMQSVFIGVFLIGMVLKIYAIWNNKYNIMEIRVMYLHPSRFLEDIIAHSHPNFNSVFRYTTVEIRAWMSNCIQLFCKDVSTFRALIPTLEWLINLERRWPRRQTYFTLQWISSSTFLQSYNSIH